MSQHDFLPVCATNPGILLYPGVLHVFLFPKIRLAEVEQASLMSEQLSDKSSSPALPDDLSLDDHSVYQLVVRDVKV